MHYRDRGHAFIPCSKGAKGSVHDAKQDNPRDEGDYQGISGRESTR